MTLTREASAVVSNVKAQDRSTVRRLGRPRANEVGQRNERILRAAGETFMQFGFDGTSMDAVVEAARISKRTLYAHYTDKAALFHAVLSDRISQWLVPIVRLESDKGELEEVLLKLARHLTTFALTPQSLDVNRIVISESQRRPEFGRLANEAGRKPAVRAIASILAQRRSELRLTNYEMAADQFLSLAVDGSLRLANLGIKLSSHEIEEWVRAAVDLFLSGARRRDGSDADKRTG